MRGDSGGFIARTGARAGVVVIAPHPDDESAGCGGLIAGCTRRGVPVRIIQLTDGAASHRSEAWPPARLAALRAAEMDRAARSLGVRDPVITLGLPDAGRQSVGAEHHAAVRVAGLLARWRPGLVLTTWRREPHCDHRLAYRVAQRACELMRTPLAEYLVWTPITGRPGDRPKPAEGRAFWLILTIEQRAAKQRALRLHASQRGEVVQDDPNGFVLNPDTEAAMTGPCEGYVLPW